MLLTIVSIQYQYYIIMILIVALDSLEIRRRSTKFSKLLQFGKVNEVNEIHGILMRFIVIHNTLPARIFFAIMGGQETKVSFGVRGLIQQKIFFRRSFFLYSLSHYMRARIHPVAMNTRGRAERKSALQGSGLVRTVQ